MAKIDVSSIDGYENMTAEEKIKTLEAFEYNDNSTELEKYKSAASKANSEAASWKKKHNELLSEDERKKQEQADSMYTDEMDALVLVDEITFNGSLSGKVKVKALI